MRLGLRLAMAAVGAVAAMGPVAARAAFVQYDCRFVVGGQRDGYWVPSQMVLRHDTASGSVTVFDPIIKHFAGNPIPARLSEETRARSTYVWSVNTRTSANQSATMDYSFSYFRNGRPATVRAIPRGYDNEFSGDGTCTVKQG
ncbi:MAG: hypothetical protein ACK4GO_08705 [Gemmobacter sp.]